MSEKTSGKPELDLQTVAQKLGVNFDMDKLLVTASQKGEFDCVEFLVKNGADVHAALMFMHQVMAILRLSVSLRTTLSRF
ncbi:ankyrin repeat domain-containing protein [Candidatus Woesearchaeota archaeon]|nr:ankyrin repeat domain-containing protein [Candidatus Woesearchaeota archaeon]